MELEESRMISRSFVILQGTTDCGNVVVVVGLVVLVVVVVGGGGSESESVSWKFIKK
jgi:hypothetical protein